MNGQRGMLLVISGPSGVGKSTIARAIEQRLGAAFSVSMTTRPRTEKDRQGVDYDFVDEARFGEAIERDELLEWAEVFGNRYGTPRRPVEARIERGETVLLEIDVEGAIQVRDRKPEAFMMFILPPSMETLLERLRARGRDDEATIQRRHREAEREIARAQRSDVYDVFLVNKDLEMTIERAVEQARRALEAESRDAARD